MSKIGNLSVKPKTIKVGSEELTLYPLNFGSRDEIAKVLDAKGNKEQMDATFELMKVVLKKSYPDMTDEEFNNISAEHIKDLTKAILELHGMSVTEEELKKMVAGKASG